MKKIIAFVILCAMLLAMVGCGNRQILDITYTYNRAIISLPNGEIIDGPVDSWKDYDGDCIQVVIDGVTYYTHNDNVVLIAEG